MILKLKWLKYLFFAAYIIFSPVSLYAFHECSVFEMPVKPIEKHRKYNKKKNKLTEKDNKSPRIPSERTWGIWSLVSGGYFILFFAMTAIFFIGYPFYVYLMAILSLLLIIGIYLTIKGVKLIDSSYIFLSDNNEIRSARIRKQMYLEWVFASFILLAALGCIFLDFYITAWLAIFAAVVLLTFAFMKLGLIKKLKKEENTFSEE